MSEQHVYIMKR